MNLQDIKPGVIVWNKWEYSIMGRDTGTNSTYMLILEVGESGEVDREGKKYKSIACQVKAINSDIEKGFLFDEHEIKKGWVRLATKAEIKKVKLEASNEIEKKILDHKTKMNVLELELSELDEKYKNFIDKAI